MYPLVFYPRVETALVTPASILSDAGQPRLGRFAGDAPGSGAQHGWPNLLFVRCETFVNMPSRSLGTHPPRDQGWYYFERVLMENWVFVAALAASFTVATVASPAGVSGAVLLLPFRVGVLDTPSPSVTPTNLLYNVVATPGALYRYWRQGQTGGRLTRLLVLGTLPGVIVGSVIRVELLPG